MQPRIAIIFFIALSMLFILNCNCQILQGNWKNSILLFEIKSNDNFIPIGTGTVIRTNDKTFFVTNYHIAIEKNLYIRFNTKNNDLAKIRYSIDMSKTDNKTDWIVNKEFDIAVFPIITYSGFRQSTYDSVNLTVNGISICKSWINLKEGDDIYVLGFPLQLGSGDKYTPLFRQGIISLKIKEGEFLIDASIFPGNSGGPVFEKNYILDSLGISVGIGRMIGIVSSYIPYQDVAISAQTKEPRVIFEENSSLARIISIDKVFELTAKLQSH
jgi:hypothetical protein